MKTILTALVSRKDEVEGAEMKAAPKCELFTFETRTG